MSEDSRPTVSGVAESMTGFDEIAIEQLFRSPVEKMSGTLQMRAMVFILRRREGMSDVDAFKAVMNLPFGDVDAQFRDEDEDEGPEVGKEPASDRNGRSSSSTAD